MRTLRHHSNINASASFRGPRKKTYSHEKSEQTFDRPEHHYVSSKTKHRIEKELVVQIPICPEKKAVIALHCLFVYIFSQIYPLNSHNRMKSCSSLSFFSKRQIEIKKGRRQSFFSNLFERSLYHSQKNPDYFLLSRKM